jgi:hypothetical protein
VEVRDKFYELDTLIWDALTEHEINEQMQQVPRMQDKIKALTQKGPKLLARIIHGGVDFLELSGD